jgi:hypothetical protein
VKIEAVQVTYAMEDNREREKERREREREEEEPDDGPS